MHTHLNLLYATRYGGQLSADQCRLITRELSGLDSSVIPSEQIQNVLDFLNQELLHQQVDRDVLEQIEELTSELALRSKKTCAPE